MKESSGGDLLPPASGKPARIDRRDTRRIGLRAMTEITYETTAEDIASRSLHVSVPMEKLEAAERKAVRQYARQARLPGFRKGHTPEAVVRRRFEAEIRQWILEESLRESWQKILEESGAQAGRRPPGPQRGFRGRPAADLRPVIEVRPQITLGTTGGFTLERTVPTGDRRDGPGAARPAPRAAGNLESARRRAAKARPPRLRHCGDTRSGEGTDRGQAALAWCSARVRRSRSWRTRIMELASPGETVDADVRFPEDHAEESPPRHGTRKVRITLHEVKEQLSLPSTTRWPGKWGVRLACRPRDRRPDRPRSRGGPHRRSGGPRPAGAEAGRGQRRPGAPVAGAPADPCLCRGVPDRPGAIRDVRHRRSIR